MMPFSAMRLRGVAGGPPPAGTWLRLAPTGAEVIATVPADCTQCEVFAIGAAGGGGIYSVSVGNSGAGGYSTGTFSVVPAETLKVRVGQGGGGGRFDAGGSSGGVAGYPGGGSGAFGDSYCGGGGGYSGVFRNDGSPLVIAGGGGGGSGYSMSAGAGGGLIGGNGLNGGGGTQSAGGVGTYPGSAYQGGSANGGDRTTSTAQDCGGGGGGFYGGGAPSGDAQTGGGGSGHIGAGVTGQTYAGTNEARPVEVPPTINAESTAGLGVGITGVSLAASPQQASSGGAGAIWLHFT